MLKKVLAILTTGAILGSSVVSANIEELSVQDKYEILKKFHIFEGYPDGEAHLDRTITRAELAVVLSRLLGLTNKVDDQVDFMDIQDHWVSKTNAVEKMVSHKIMIGKGNNRFDPDGLVTIEEIAAVITRALGIEAPPATYTDAKASDWAQGYVDAAVKAGILDPQLDYTIPATRAILVEAVYMELTPLPKKD